MKIKFLLLIVMISFLLLSCGVTLDEVTNQTRIDVENYIQDNFKEYNLKLETIDLIKNENNYKGTVSILYKEEKTEFPITVIIKDKEYSYDFIIHAMKIKGIAEDSAKKLLEDKINEDGWAKENDLSVKEINLYPETDNSYEGLVTFIHSGKEHKTDITFRYDKNGGYMYSLANDAFSFLF